MHDWKRAIRDRLLPMKLDPTSENDLVEELAQHLEDRYQELQANGITEKESARRTMAELGNPDLLASAALLRRGLPGPAPALGVPASKRTYVGGLTLDLKVGFRNLRSKPLFSLMIIGMLALGVAGNAAVFSVFDSLFLRPLPFVHSNRLIDLDETAPKWNLQHVGVSNADLFEWHENNSTFDNMAFFRGRSFNLYDGDAAQRVQGAQVTSEMVDVLGLEPFIGRSFSIEDDKPGGARVVLLNYGLWQRLFQGDPNALGRVLKLDEQPYTVIGVLPRNAVFPDRAELWVPLAADRNINSGYYLNGVARLKRGVSLEQAQADLLRIHKAMISHGHKVNEITSPILTPLRDRYLGEFRTVSQALLFAVGFVLLIACVNIGALMMVRGSSRSREMAIRAALGASRSRIVAQLVTESLVLAVLGSVLGVLFGEVSFRAVVPFLSDQLPQWISFSFDWRIVLFCITIMGVAALLFGLVPALQASRVDIRGSLHDAGARTTASRGERATLRFFVISEIGLALMLSISAGLLVQAFQKVLSVDPGFRPENVLTFRVTLPDTTYDKPAKNIAYYDRLLEWLCTLPGVTATGATSAPPLGGQWGGVFEAEGGRDVGTHGENPTILQVTVTPGYFDAIGMTLLYGRAFQQLDGEPTPRMVAMVNETFVKHFWRNGSPIGKRIRRLGETDWYQVIGVLRDEKHYGLDQEVKPSVFLPYPTAMLTALRGDERAFQEMSIVLRSSIDPKILLGPVREEVRRLDSSVPMYEVHSMTEQLDRSLWARRAYSWLFGAFAMIAILLSAAGISGTVSYRVSQRTQEIGIRMALGAQPNQVLGQVLLGGMQLVLIGVAVGLVGALWTADFLQTLLFGVNSRDPVIYAVVVLGIVAVALLATFVPARRAAKLDPLQALRLE